MRQTAQMIGTRPETLESTLFQLSAGPADGLVECLSWRLVVEGNDPGDRVRPYNRRTERG
jgi:hypothetical protein